MAWDQLAREWRRVVDYVKSKLEAGNDESQDDDGESSLLGGAWSGQRGRFAFPPVLEPALARSPRK
jgi:hypothetical protein